LQNAFVTVPYQRLLTKIFNYGLKGKVLDWIKIFLVNTKHRVVINGVLSRWIEVLNSIPQGSVLGPDPFVLFINDLPNLVKSSVYLSADDRKIFWEVLLRMRRFSYSRILTHYRNGRPSGFRGSTLSGVSTIWRRKKEKK